MKDNDKYTVCVAITPQFHELDPMQVVWHGNYPKYLEKARDTFFKQHDYYYDEMQKSNYAWPVVDMRIKYKKIITLNQEILVYATLKECENRLKFDYKIVDAKTQQVLTTAYTIQVAVNMQTNEMCFVTPKFILDLFKWES